MLFPLSFSELKAEKNSFQLQEFLPDFMVTGGYRRLMQFTTKKQTIAHLRELASSYLYKDILEFSKIKHVKKIYDLLRLLAF